MILIFDGSQYPAPCLGRHNIDDDDPVRVTDNANAKAMPGEGFEDEDTADLFLDADPDQGGMVLVDVERKAEASARVALAGVGVLGLVVAAGVANYILRNRVPDLSPQEEQALDIIGDALPDVATLRTLLGRSGLAADLSQAKTILETLAAS